MQEAFNNCYRAVSDAWSTERYMCAVKNKLRAELIEIMMYLGTHVIMGQKGAQTPLISSGFPLRKTSDQAWLRLPKGFAVLPGKDSGENMLKIKRRPVFTLSVNTANCMGNRS